MTRLRLWVLPKAQMQLTRAIHGEPDFDQRLDEVIRRLEELVARATSLEELLFTAKQYYSVDVAHLRIVFEIRKPFLIVTNVYPL